MKNKHHTYDSKVLTITVKSPGTGSYTWMERISEFLKEKGILK